MKTCFLGTGGYVGEVASRAWPVPPEQCSREEAMRSMDTAIRQYKLAEEVGFDWVSISEHHYSPGQPADLAGEDRLAGAAGAADQPGARRRGDRHA